MRERHFACLLNRRRILQLFAVGACAAPAGLVRAAMPEPLHRSAEPEMVSGEGDREFDVEGPCALAWRSAGGSFAIKATAEGADKPAAASSTQGRGQGRLKLAGEKVYRISIAASNSWSVTVSW